MPTRESPSCRNRMAQFARRRYTALCVEALEHGKAWLIRGELVYVDDNSDSAGRERIGNVVPPWAAQKIARGDTILQSSKQFAVLALPMWFARDADIEPYVQPPTNLVNGAGDQKVAGFAMIP